MWLPPAGITITVLTLVVPQLENAESFLTSGRPADKDPKVARTATPMMKAMMACGSIFNMIWLWRLIHICELGEVVSALALAFILADIVSGIYHWFQDSYRSKSDAVNQALFENFQMHHEVPHLITKHDWQYVSWELGASAFLGSLVGYAYGGTSGRPSDGWILWHTFWLFGMWINHVHRCAHLRYRIPWPLQSAKHHALHHQRPELRSYCILSVLNNGWMDFVGVWAIAEWIIYHVFGAVSFRMAVKDPARHQKASNFALVDVIRGREEIEESLRKQESKQQQQQQRKSPPTSPPPSPTKRVRDAKSTSA